MKETKHNHEEFECPYCADERRHQEMMYVLSEINRSLSEFMLEYKSDTSLMSIGEKLDSIARAIKYR